MRLRKQVADLYAEKQIPATNSAPQAGNAEVGRKRRREEEPVNTEGTPAGGGGKGFFSRVGSFLGVGGGSDVESD